MKKLSVFVLLMMALPVQAKLNVFACEPEWASLTEALAGDKAKVYQATTARQDAHRIEARPSLIAKTRKADLMVCAGADLEVGWLPLLQRQAGNNKIQHGKPGYFEAAMQVERLGGGKEADRAGGDVHTQGNPHVHLDPYRMLKIAQALSERLTELDPANSDHYAQRYQAFEQSWKQAITRWEAQAAPLKGQKVITYHKNWTYLLDWLGIEGVGDLEPKPGLPPTAGHLSQLVGIAKREQPFAILTAAYQNPKSGRWLEKRTGAKALVLPFTVGGSDEANDLISLYDDTLAILLEAANSKE